MIETIQRIIHSVADFCGDIATILGLVFIGLVFVVYFIAFAIGEFLGLGKID